MTLFSLIVLHPNRRFSRSRAFNTPTFGESCRRAPRLAERQFDAASVADGRTTFPSPCSSPSAEMEPGDVAPKNRQIPYNRPPEPPRNLTRKIFLVIFYLSTANQVASTISLVFAIGAFKELQNRSILLVEALMGISGPSSTDPHAFTHIRVSRSGPHFLPGGRAAAPRSRPGEGRSDVRAESSRLAAADRPAAARPEDAGGDARDGRRGVV